MTDQLPPPEEPMGEQARARIRAELLEAAQSRPSGSRGWAVPLTAAAAVVLVAGVTAWAVGGPGDDATDRNGPATSASPTPAPTAVPSPSDPPTSDPSSVPSSVPSSAESSTPAPTPTSGPSPTAAVSVAPGKSPGIGCSAALRYVLRGAGMDVVFPEDDESTTFWVKGDRFSLCNSLDGRTTVHQPLPLVPDLDDVATWRVSSVFAPLDDGYQAVRVAGGVVPEGAPAFDVAYTFPDGHTEQATTVTDDDGRTWWRMAYAYDDGGGNELRKPPIEVTVSLSGVQKEFTLEWGVDTCAQANHGC